MQIKCWDISASQKALLVDRKWHALGSNEWVKQNLREILLILLVLAITVRNRPLSIDWQRLLWGQNILKFYVNYVLLEVLSSFLKGKSHPFSIFLHLLCLLQCQTNNRESGHFLWWFINILKYLNLFFIDWIGTYWVLHHLQLMHGWIPATDLQYVWFIWWEVCIADLQEL